MVKAKLATGSTVQRGSRYHTGSAMWERAGQLHRAGSWAAKAAHVSETQIFAHPRALRLRVRNTFTRFYLS